MLNHFSFVLRPLVLDEGLVELAQPIHLKLGGVDVDLGEVEPVHELLQGVQLVQRVLFILNRDGYLR